MFSFSNIAGLCQGCGTCVSGWCILHGTWPLIADGAFGSMVALRGTEIIRVPLAEATTKLKLVPPERYAEAEVFFG